MKTRKQLYESSDYSRFKVIVNYYLLLSLITIPTF